LTRKRRSAGFFEKRRLLRERPFSAKGRQTVRKKESSTTATEKESYVVQRGGSEKIAHRGRKKVLKELPLERGRQIDLHDVEGNIADPVRGM